jgi:hypothetical protein
MLSDEQLCQKLSDAVAIPADVYCLGKHIRELVSEYRTLRAKLPKQRWWFNGDVYFRTANPDNSRRLEQYSGIDGKWHLVGWHETDMHDDDELSTAPGGLPK